MPPLVVVLCALIAASCSGDDNGTGVPNPTVVVAASVTISPSAVALIVPDSVQLTAVVRDGNGIVMPNATVSWSVGNAQTASVSANGMLRALQAGARPSPRPAHRRAGRRTRDDRFADLQPRRIAPTS
ncbi:MAG: Ig-like domain-containing protein [Gemmatimonadetes bacterium]|nr:Ig-like domain-containing protein [Gemmatimonadota bacterium]